MAPTPPSRVHTEREVLLQQLDDILDRPMVVLSLIWVALLVAELVGGGLPPLLDAIVWFIWGVFVVDFLLEFVIAPVKTRYLRTHLLTLVSLVLPAFRLLRFVAAFRLLRAARVVRSVGMVRILTSVNRGLASLRVTAARRGLGYVLGATVLVMLVGSAGMAWFEGPETAGPTPGPPTAVDAASLADFGDALWWTASAMTTGVPFEPATAEGKILGWLLSLYGLGIFGYLTATLAGHFVGRDRAAPLGAPRSP